MQLENLFHISRLPGTSQQEIFETLCASKTMRIERIISTGQTTPANTWLAQPENEWVILLQGNAQLEFVEGKIIQLLPGDYLIIPSGTKHRVSYTSTDTPCIWLAIHYT